jgi:hypothetical protein
MICINLFNVANLGSFLNYEANFRIKKEASVNEASSA